MVFISGTRIHLRAWRFFPRFFLYAQRSTRQARLAEGNLQVDLHRDPMAGFWTRSLWRDEAAMRAFMMSGTTQRQCDISKTGPTNPASFIGRKNLQNLHLGLSSVGA